MAAFNHQELTLSETDTFLDDDQILDQEKSGIFHSGVTEDTWIMTNLGPRMVKDLIDYASFEIHIGCKHSYSPIQSNGFFPTGIKSIFLLETKQGFSIKVTSNHRLLSMSGKMITVNDLKKGDKLKLKNFKHNWYGEGNFNSGYLLGQIKGNGSLTSTSGVLYLHDSKQPKDLSHVYMKDTLNTCLFKEFGRLWNWNNTPGGLRLDCRQLLELSLQYGMSQGNKNVSDQIEQASREFQIGFIRGFFDTDGCVFLKPPIRIISLSQSSLPCLQRIQRMLLNLGIISRIRIKRLEGETMIKDVLYHTKTNYNLNITGDSIFKFYKIIGLFHRSKKMKLKKIINSYELGPRLSDNFITFDKISCLDKERVYNVIIQDEKHSYQTNGFISHDYTE